MRFFEQGMDLRVNFGMGRGVMELAFKRTRSTGRRMKMRRNFECPWTGLKFALSPSHD